MWATGLYMLALCVLVHSKPTNQHTYDTIIVGLGASGVTAANTLCNAGKKVLGLEAQNRIGGRVYTVHFGDGVVEVGAEWLHGSKNSRTYELAMKHNISIVSQNGDYEVYRSDGSLADKALMGELMQYCLELTFDPPETPEPLGQFVTRKLHEYLQTNHPDVWKDQDYVAQFLHFMEVYVNGYESASSWNNVSTYSDFVRLEGDQELSWHRNGYKTLFDILLNTYNNGPGLPNFEVQLNKEVVLISWPEDPQEPVTVTCKDGSVYTAQNVIVTVSVGVLKERHTTLFAKPLPEKKVEAINAISIGAVIKMILKFEQPWWNASSEFLWRGEDRSAVKEEDLWTTSVEGGTEIMGCGNCLSFWVTGKYVGLVETLPEGEVITKLMAVIRRFMGKTHDIPEPTGMVRSTWLSNPFTRGTYTYDNLHTTEHLTARADLAAPLVDASGAPRVMFAGEATDSIHFSTVHGATDTGFREANRILTAGVMKE